jgi:hypothetical protein
MACVFTFTIRYVREASDLPRTDLSGLFDIAEELAIISSNDKNGIKE